MSESILIRHFIEDDFPCILIIANSRFGKDYLSRDDLHSYLNNDNKIGLVAIVNGEIAGFALGQICTVEEAMALVLFDHDWFREQFSDKDYIGVLKTIAVHSTFSDLGIGSALTERRIQFFKEKTGYLLAISWEQKENISNRKILEKSGLDVKRRIENYWREDSLLKEYSCKQCGAPPCQCTALIYMK